jgi:hypothetical protein
MKKDYVDKRAICRSQSSTPACTSTAA